jgi:formylglycine-generating enzyme required for sulfatase activity
MNDFPLQRFFEELPAEDIRLTVRDYERLSRAFRQGGEWSILRLKHVLVALLARDPDQQRLIGRKFDRFFAPEVADRKIPAGRDVREILRKWLDAGDWEPKPPNDREPGTGPPGDNSPPVVIPPKKELFVRPGTVLYFLFVSILTAFFHFQTIPEPKKPPPPPAPIFQLHPSTIGFGSLPPGEERTVKFTVSNGGDAPLRILEMVETQDADEVFQPTFPDLPATLETEAELAVPVVFRPSAAGDFDGEIRIRHDAGEEAATVALQGSGVVYRRVPFVAKIRREPLERSTSWLMPAAIAVVYFMLVIWCWNWLRRLEKPPLVQAPKVDPKKEKFFHPGDIGGKPEPRLDEATLAELADSMGYFRSEEPGRALDVAASIRATVRQGGIPDCRFFRRKRLRTLLILEDEASEARTWNPVAKELRDGMKRYGVPVDYGSFRGSPDVYRDGDGREHFLEDWEDLRRGVLVLLFTDGKGFARPRNALALEGLARWPMAAWMDLREERFWDETLEPAIQRGIPPYPATGDGLLRAVRRYLTERGGADRPTRALIRERRGPGVSTRFGVEHFLGDALPWVLDCSVMQPVPVGLADALRREFHPHLPPEAMERLHALDNSAWTDAGIRFSREVQKRLRQGLQARRNRAERRKVTEFIRRKIDEARPEDAAEDSLKRLSWEAVRVRVAAETGAEGALKRLAELAHSSSPLSQFLGDSLGNYGLPGAEDGEQAPLLERPESFEGERWLRSLPGNPMGIVLPKNWRLRVALRVLAVAWLGYSWWAAKEFVRPVPNWEIQVAEPGLANAEAVLEAKAGEVWREEMRGTLGSLGGIHLPSGQEYRLAISDPDASSETPFQVVWNETAVLLIEGKNVATATVATSPIPVGTKPGDTWTEPHTRMTFMWVPGGTFEMGCGEWQTDCWDNEKPVSQVTVSGFWMGKYEVTVGEFQAFLKDTGYRGEEAGWSWNCDAMATPQGFEQKNDHPVSCVTWNEAVAFAKWLSEKNDDGIAFRLPTEAEWEFACRSGGENQRYCGGDDIDSFAWYSNNSGSTTHTVGTKAANGLELHDMSGNVWEYCQDWYGNYSQETKTNPMGPDQGSDRVLRGGSWFNDARDCRSSNRDGGSPEPRLALNGFRLVLPPVR